MPARRPLLHAIGNAHIDPVWLWTWNEGLEEIRSTFRSVLDLLSEYPGFIFTSTSAAFYWQLEQVAPEIIAEIRQRVGEGRWEIAGGWWVEPDVNIPCGESLARQALNGQRYFERTFGVRAEVGFNPDTFGHCGQLPQILSGAGQRFYAFLRPGPHEMDLPGPVFWWTAPGGGRVLASRIADAYGTWADSAEEMEAHILSSHRARPDYLPDYTVFYGVGNHGGGPTRRNIEILSERGDTEPAAEMSSLSRYFTSQSQAIDSGAVVPEHFGPLQYHARGCYSAHSEIKRQNRRCENLLLTAEKLAAMAQALGARQYPKEQLSDAWRLLLFNQFHDIIAGTSIPDACRDACDQMGRAASIADEAIHFSVQSVARLVDTQGRPDALIVFNPLPWHVRAPIEVEPAQRWPATPPSPETQGLPGSAGELAPGFQEIQASSITGPKRAVFVPDLPALGWRAYSRSATHHNAASDLPGMLEAGENWLENTAFRLEVDRQTGEITSLYDKRHNVEMLFAPACFGLVLEDPSDTWSHGVDAYRDEIGRFGGASVTLEETGPVRAALRIETGWGASKITHRVYLYRDLEFVECRLTIDWREQYRALKLSLPVGVEEPEATCETPYGCAACPVDGTEQPGQQWADITGTARAADGRLLRCGLALLNDCKYGFSFAGSDMRMTMARSPAFAHHHPAQLDSVRRYPHLDQQEQTVTLRLVPHAGGWQDAAIPRRACELNARPFHVNESFHKGRLPETASFLWAEPANIVLTALKQAEDSEDLVVRGYESCGLQTEAKMLLPMLGVEWTATFAPHQIRTWLLEPGRGPLETNLLEEPVR